MRTYPLIYSIGIAKPVYRTTKNRRTEAGARACSMLLLIDAISRNSILIESNIVKETKRKKKKGPGSRRKFAMKYRVQLTKRTFNTL